MYFDFCLKDILVLKLAHDKVLPTRKSNKEKKNVHILQKFAVVQNISYTVTTFDVKQNWEFSKLLNKHN